MGVRIETLSVREAREQLPSVLERFRNGDRTPVGVGSHRRMEAIVIPVQVFDELISERTRAVSAAAASVRAEGLTPDPSIELIVRRWAVGELTTDEMRDQVRHHYSSGD